MGGGGVEGETATAVEGSWAVVKLGGLGFSPFLHQP